MKRNCKMCKKRSNLAFDPENLLCPDCLILWRDNVIDQHRNGKMPFQQAYESVLNRCRMNEAEVQNLIFPPLGDGDFQSDETALKLNFNMKEIEKLERRQEEE